MVSATSVVLWEIHFPSSLPASISGKFSLSTFSSRQSNMRLGSVILIVWIKVTKNKHFLLLSRRHLVILTLGQFKDPPLLKIYEPIVVIAIRIRQGLKSRQVAGRAEDPLVIGVKHPIL